MAMKMIKSDPYLGRDVVSMMDGEAPEVMPVKRRKRDASAIALSCDNQQTPNQQVDPTSAATTVKRSSRFRGVSRHKWTGRYEAHLWDKLTWNVTQKKKGKQGTQEEAAHAYDIAAIEYRGINAVTNFDLSTYIRWLKPGASTSVPDKKTTPCRDSPAIFSNFRTGEESLSPFMKRRAFSADDLTKQERFANKVPVTPCTKSSPTALSLLLRSSVFKELVEKNSNVEEEIDGESMRNQKIEDRHPELGAILYDGIEDRAFVFSSNANTFQLQGPLHFNYDCEDMVGSNTIGMPPIC